MSTGTSRGIVYEFADTFFGLGNSNVTKDGKIIGNGFQVLHAGPDAWIWRVRDGRCRVILERKEGNLYRSNGASHQEEKPVPIGKKGAYVSITSPFIKAGDKIIEAPFGASKYVAPFVSGPFHAPVHHTA